MSGQLQGILKDYRPGITVPSTPSLANVTINSLNNSMLKKRSNSPDSRKKTAGKSLTFVPKNSKSHFSLTEEESDRLENLFRWQEASSKSTLVLGGPVNF
jgi:hypothetical protein